MFLGWEQNIPKLGINCTLIGNSSRAQISVFRKIYPKSPYPSLRTSGNPINKGFLVFNPSLHLSRHPSLIPPINSFRQPNEGEVIKTMNCDQIISIMQKDYPTLQNTMGNKVKLGRAITALGFKHKEHSHAAYYEVVPLKAA